jgi:hypothetical protein
MTISLADAFTQIQTGPPAPVHPYGLATLLRLWEEVRGFWQGRDMRRTTSSFHNR